MRNWGNSLADASADVSAFTPIEGKGYDSYDSVFYTDTGMVIPANLKAVLDFRPIRTTLTITIDAVPASLVEWEVAPSGAGVVAVNYLTGELAFHADDLGKTAAGSYKHLGTVIDQHLFNKLQLAVDGKAEASHVHAISDVTDLQSELDGKQPYDPVLDSVVGDYNDGFFALTYNSNTFSSLQTFSSGATLNGPLRPNGGWIPKLTDISGVYTILPTDFYIQVNIFGAGYVVNLPALSSVPNGQFYKIFIRNGSSNSVTLTAASGEFIISNVYTNTYAFNGAGGKWFDLMAASTTEWLILPGVAW